MDQARMSALLLSHRHSDGTWSRLEPRSHHDAADHDPERGWPAGRIFACPRCEEEVLVETTNEDERHE